MADDDEVVLSYTTPERNRPVELVTFEMDGERYQARRPKDSVLVYLEAANAGAATTADKLHAAMQFVDGCLTPASQQRIGNRLRDHDDPLELEDLIRVCGDLSEHWGQKNTPQPVKSARDRPRVITPDGEDAFAIEPADEPAPSRTARRTAAKAPGKTAKAVASPTRTGRALPR